MMHSTSIKKIIAGVAAVATAAIGLALAAPAANAAEGDWDSTATTGTLVIHKRAMQGGNTQTRGTGVEDDNVQGDPIPGATFQLYKVNGPHLKTADSTDWDLGNLTYDSSTSKFTSPASAASWSVSSTPLSVNSNNSFTTGPNGDVTISNIPLGLYRVVETGVPDNVDAATDPFFVSLPYPNNGKWLYTVHVYPKNEKKIQKTVDTGKALTTGDPIDWNVDENVYWKLDGQGNKENWETFGISDPLDSHVSPYNPDSSLSDPVQGYVDVYVNRNASQANDNGTELPKTDYTVSYDTSSNTLKVVLKGDALTNLNNGSYTNIRFKIHAKVTNTTDLTDNYVPNTVQKLDNHGNPTGNPVKASKVPYVGNMKFTKVDDSTPAKPLAGATFKLWRANADGTCGSAVPTDGRPVYTQTSAASTGVVSFQNIFIKNDAPNATNVQGTFCLVESKAPDGYMNAGTVRTIVLNAGDNDGFKQGSDTIKQIVNTHTTGPKLPLTGAAGRLLLILGAIAILAAAAALYVVNKRRQNANANR